MPRSWRRASTKWPFDEECTVIGNCFHPLHRYAQWLEWLEWFWGCVWSSEWFWAGEALAMIKPFFHLVTKCYKQLGMAGMLGGSIAAAAPPVYLEHLGPNKLQPDLLPTVKFMSRVRPCPPPAAGLNLWGSACTGPPAETERPTQILQLKDSSSSPRKSPNPSVFRRSRRRSVTAPVVRDWSKGSGGDRPRRRKGGGVGRGHGGTTGCLHHDRRKLHHG